MKALVERLPQEYTPYSRTKSIHLLSHVKSLKFTGIHQAVALTDSKVTSIIFNIMSILEKLII